MNDFISAIILGVIEGVTEFLPVSSTGHLIIANQWISFSQEFTHIFDVVIQLGAILAVLTLFWDRLWPFGKSDENKRNVFDIWKKAAVGVLPALFLGFFLGEEIQDRLFNPVTVAIMLFLGGVLLLLVEKKRKTPSFLSIQEIGYGTVLFIGLAQSVAMIPGTSRSAATIIGGIFLGLSRVAAAEFSFFLAIPTMFAASGYVLIKNQFHFGTEEILILTTGFVVSFITAWIVVKKFIEYIQNNDFRYFGYYRIMLGIIVFLYFFQGW